MTQRLIPLQGVYPKEIKTCAHTKTFTQMFTETLLLVTKSWQHSKRPFAEEWVNTYGTPAPQTLLGSKKEQSTDTRNATDEPLKHHAEISSQAQKGTDCMIPV